MNDVMKLIISNSKNIIIDNNFLFTAFQNRLVIRIVHIFEKYKVSINKQIIIKNMEEQLINSLIDINCETIKRYVDIIYKYEKIISTYIDSKTNAEIIKQSTKSFIKKIHEKNSCSINKNISSNFIDYINSITFVYDNNNLNNELSNRINKDINEIINEFNRNNYNFVIESINMIIKDKINKI